MARKLSGIARRRSCILATMLCLVTAPIAPAQEKLRVSTPREVVANPFARGESRSVTVPNEPESPRRVKTIYDNPFAKTRHAPLKLAPSVEPPSRPGPISRWQPPNLLANEPSSVRTAILETVPTSFDPIPPGGLIGSTAAANPGFGLPADPIQFAPRPLSQPAWLTSEVRTARPLPPALPQPDLGPPAIEAYPNTEALFSAPTDDLGPVEGAATIMGDVATSVASPDWLPIIVSDQADVPENCYDEARKLSETAQTVDELSTVIDKCRRGLSSAPPEDLALALRRLAAWAYNHRGELRSEAHEQQEALADFQAAVANDPTSWVAIHNRGVTLAQQGELSAALRDFNRVLELNPSLTVAYRNRAELLASLGRMDEAVNDYSKVLEESPSDFELYRARGYAWQRLGDFDRALADLNKSIEIEPNDPDTHTQRGNLAAEQGKFDEAIRNYQQALTIDPKWGDAHRSQAWLWATCPNPQHRDAARALAAAAAALALAPDGDSFVLDAAAAAHANAGQFEKAIELQQQAVASAPAEIDEPMHQRLALYKQGQPFRSRPSASAVKAASHAEPANRRRSK